MVKIINMMLPPGSLGRPGSPLNYRGVTIHNTGNPSFGANALANVNYMLENAHNMYNSWHYTVDEDYIIRSVPENEEAYHTGNSEGNHTTIGIEITENSDGNILQATDNAARLAADILRRHGDKQAVWKQNIFQHNDWTGKDCPGQIRRGNPYGWTEFLGRVNRYLQQPEMERILKYNARFLIRDGDVRAVQNRLKIFGFYQGVADGIYGPETARAVRAFQVDRGIRPADGIVGEDTWTVLWA